jgi:flagellin
MIINTNTGSANAARILAESTSALQKSLKRLSTGSRIASIADDAGGSAVASKFSAQVTRLNASRANVGNMIPSPRPRMATWRRWPGPWSG